MKYSENKISNFNLILLLLIFVFIFESCMNCRYKLNSKYLKTNHLFCELRSDLKIEKLKVILFKEGVPNKYEVIGSIENRQVNPQVVKKVKFKNKKSSDKSWYKSEVRNDSTIFISNKSYVDFDTCNWYKINGLSGGSRLMISLNDKAIFFYVDKNKKIKNKATSEIVSTGGF